MSDGRTPEDVMTPSPDDMSPGLPDACFENDGLITKRPQRAAALAQLRPMPGQLLWDVGTGSGAIAIEWCRAAEGATAIGLERKTERAERARRNIDRLAPGRVDVRIGEATELMAELPAPDAVFIGGGVTDGVLELCWQALKPGGRIVAHGVTLEADALLMDWQRSHGGELTRLEIATAQPIGRFIGWVPFRPVTEWSAVR